MAREYRHPPSAASLTASMRDLGYSLETAIADLVDNSISASASIIDIVCDMSSDQPVVSIIDNGQGMTAKELLAAMRHGSGNPRQHRSHHDLGRFGLGLKTASFSQCRSLTVISTKHGAICGAEWNLDRIDTTDDWVLNIFEEADIQTLPHIERLGNQGTAVIWRELDRLVEDAEGEHRDEIVYEKLEAVGRHLALVFHLYISGEVKGYSKLTININGHPISAFDPFCRNNPATQHLPEEIVRIDNKEIRIQPYILPHHSRLSAKDYDYYSDRSDFISNQGSYIYRNGRLMAWGDWFRLAPKSEATKLARVRIDFPNSLDEEWTIDIKKSRARPPHIVRERLRQILVKISERSITVHKNRAQRLYKKNPVLFWERFIDQKGIIFSINSQHPLILSLKKELSKKNAQTFGLILDSISASLPIEMIYSDYSTHPQKISTSPSTNEDKLNILKNLKTVLYGNGPVDAKAFLDVVHSTNIFDGQIEIVEKFIKEISVC